MMYYIMIIPLIFFTTGILYLRLNCQFNKVATRFTVITHIAHACCTFSYERDLVSVILVNHFKIKKKFFVGSRSFCGVTGALCFGLRMTLPMGFKARMDSLSPMLFCCLCAAIPSHPWFPGLGIKPRSLTYEVNTIPLCQPGPANFF